MPNFPKDEIISELEFQYDQNLCTKCGKCVTVCCYATHKLEFPNMTLDKKECRSCGICEGVCPTGALSSTVQIY